MLEKKKKKSNTSTQKESERVHSILDKYLLVCAPAVGNESTVASCFYFFSNLN